MASPDYVSGTDTENRFMRKRNDAGHPPTTCRVQIPILQHDARGARNRDRNQHINIAYGNNDSKLAMRPEEGYNKFVGFAIPPLTIYICLIFNFYQLSTPVQQLLLHVSQISVPGDNNIQQFQVV